MRVVTTMLTRYCEVCGRRVKISLAKIRRLDASRKKIACDVCKRRQKLGHYDEKLLDRHDEM